MEGSFFPPNLYLYVTSFIGYEEWDEGDDKKWIMTWKVTQEFDKLIEYN